MISAPSRSDGARTNRQPGPWWVGLSLCALMTACTTTSTSVDQSESPPVAAASTGWLPQGKVPTVIRLSSYPATPTQIRTTSASIYLGNLDARIAHLEKTYASQPRADVANALALSLGHRFQIIGRLSDALRARAVVSEQLQANPAHPQLLLAHARQLSQFHDFDQALAALDRIDQPGPALTAPIAGLRGEIAQALGRYEQLGERFWKPEAPGSADVYELAARANAAVLQGNLDLASRLYFDAQSRYRDVGPFPLAWLHTQQGIALLRFGHIAEAAKFFSAARERLPQYYLATEHLAECLTELGEFDRARELYMEVITQTGNPEFMAAIAGLEEQAGNADKAAQWRSRADSGYQSLLADQAGAYTQHAAEFYLEIGNRQRAEQLASDNLRRRQDVDSRLLLAQVALAQGQQTRACEQIQQAIASGLNPPELGELRAEAGCTPK